MINPKINCNRRLIWFAFKGEVDAVRGLLQEGVDVDHQSEANPRKQNGMAAIHAASIGNHFSILQLLVQQSANVNLTMIGGFTALHLAASGGHNESAELLLDYRADTEQRDWRGQTPLFKANERLTGLLLERGANPYVKDKYGDSPLHYAAFWGDLGAAYKLISVLCLTSGFDIAALNGDLQTPLWLACHGPDSHGNPSNRLQIVRDLLSIDSSMPHVDRVSNLGTTALQAAIMSNRPALVGELLEHNANTSHTFQSKTVLHLAAEIPSPKILGLLLRRFKSVDELDPMGSTALHMSVIAGCLESVKMLVKARAAVEAARADGLTPLYLAVKSQRRDILEFILKKSASPYPVDERGRTILHQVGDSQKILELLLRGVSEMLKTKDKNGDTPLHLYVCAATPRMTEILLKSKPPLDTQNNKGNTPIEELFCNESLWTGRNGDTQLRLSTLRLLLEAGAEVSSKCTQAIEKWGNASLTKEVKKHLPWTGIARVLVNPKKKEILAGGAAAMLVSPPLGALVVAGGCAVMLWNGKKQKSEEPPRLVPRIETCL
jgi:ankyrin repeat protein